MTLQSFSTRFNSYTLGIVYKSINTFKEGDEVSLIKDEPYFLIPAHKSLVVLGGKITASALLPSGKVEFYLASSLRNKVPLFPAFFANVDISAAATEAVLVPGTFAKKLNHFVLNDVIPATKTNLLEENWNCLSLYFKVTGAAVPANYQITIDLDLCGIEGSGRK